MQDVEDDSVGLGKSVPARCSSSKRCRSAEVHNLSERVSKLSYEKMVLFFLVIISPILSILTLQFNDQRRRDRINEKMRALQELIPNCNKVHSKLH